MASLLQRHLDLLRHALKQRSNLVVDILRDDSVTPLRPFAADDHRRFSTAFDSIKLSVGNMNRHLGSVPPHFSEHIRNFVSVVERRVYEVRKDGRYG